MQRPLTARERRIGAWMLLGFVAWGLLALLDSLWLEPLRTTETRISELAEQQRHYRRLLSQRQPLQAALAEVRQSGASDRDLLSGDDPSAVAADLMQNLAAAIKRQEATGAGCSLEQRMPILAQPSDASPYRPIKVTMELACGVEPLERLLHEFEYSQPALFVEDLNIRRAANASAPAGSNIGPGRLSVHLLVTGYMTSSPVQVEEAP